MKQSLFFSLIILLIHSGSADASEVCKNIYGVLHCASGEVESINHLGRAYLSGTHVLGQTHIIGDVDVLNTELNAANIIGNVTAEHLVVQANYEATGDMRTAYSEFRSPVHIIGEVDGNHDNFNKQTTVIGATKLSHDVFKQNAEFTGKLYAAESEFFAPIRINTCIAEFYHSKLAPIELSAQRDCSSNTQKLYLYDKSQVQGNVVFQGGNGKIYLSKDSNISGQVIGGVVVRE